MQNKPLLPKNTLSKNLKNSEMANMRDKTLTSIGSLIKLLPTGTVFIFQFLSPVLTNNGQCHVVHKTLTSILIGFCGLSCCFSSFTDSYTDEDGNTHYGIATKNGIWPSFGKEDLSAYKLRFGDFVHAFFSVVVFTVVSLLDHNVVDCFYPSFESTGKVLLMAMPPVIGTVAGSVFMVFPNTRHGIGYPYSGSTAQAQAQSLRRRLTVS